MADNKQSAQTSEQAQAPSTPKVGREKSLDVSKYNVENLHYPIDLFSNAGSGLGKVNKSQFFNQQYLNYVVFYINVSDQSRVFTEGKAEIVGDVDIFSNLKVKLKLLKILMIRLLTISDFPKVKYS
jgi:hypothetical protein